MAYSDSYEGLTGVVRQDKNRFTEAVSFDVYLADADVTEGQRIPPDRFDNRDRRLEDLENLWYGNLGDDIDLGLNPVVPNTFRTHSTQLANLLLMEEPTAEGVTVMDRRVETLASEQEVMFGPGERNGLRQVFYDALIDMDRFGGAILLLLQADVTELLVPSPRNWYPSRDGGHYLIRKWLSDEADSVNPDRIDIVRVSEGEAISTTRRFMNGRLGPTLSTDELGDAMVEIVARDPADGIWGTAKYLEMYPMVLETARRYSRNSRILDLFGKPVPVFNQAEADAISKFGIPSTDTDAQKQRKIAEGYLGLLEGDTLHLDDDLLGLDYLQPNVQGVDQALRQVQAMKDEIREATGMPSLQGQTLSGEALKRLFVHWYAETKEVLTSLSTAVSALLGVNVTATHPFDSSLIFSETADATSDPDALPTPDEPEEQD